MLKALLDDFSGHNIDAACALVETAGRFFYRCLLAAYLLHLHLFEGCLEVAKACPLNGKLHVAAVPPTSGGHEPLRSKQAAPLLFPPALLQAAGDQHTHEQHD